MSKVRAHISTSLDGYVAGPNQSQEEPLGEGGERLHDWLVRLKAWREPSGLEGGEENVSSSVVAEEHANVGAEIMGRGKFGPASRGPWGDDPWRGWWGDQPPFHAPVYVLTHTAPRPSIPMAGGTTFHFRTTAIDDVLAEATDAAGGLDVRVGGGVGTARAFLLAGLVDDLHVAIAPILLGRGHRLWDDLRGLELSHKVTTEVAESGTIHVTFKR